MANAATREKIEECFMLFDQECTGELTVGKFYTVSVTFTFALFDDDSNSGPSGSSTCSLDDRRSERWDQLAATRRRRSCKGTVA